jgi:hypothetical protein
MITIWRIRAVRVAILSGMMLVAGGHGAAPQWDPIFHNLPLDELEKKFSKVKDAVKNAKDMDELKEKQDKYYKDLGTLSPDDDKYEPDYKLPGTPELPSLCKDSPKCEACFKQPYADLQNTRFRFEKLRRLNKVTKDMLRDAVSFGDAAASAAGGLAPLAWNSEKAKIRVSEENFNKTYDAKYAELLGTLKDNLFGIAACEEQIFGNQSWYDRFGFMYQQFMAVAYRRPD